MICFDSVGADWIIVPVVSGHSKTDLPCNLIVGEHDWLQWASRVDFGWLRRVSKQHVEDCIKSGLYKQKSAISRDVAARMYQTFLVSDEVEPWVMKLCGARVTGYLTKLQ